MHKTIAYMTDAHLGDKTPGIYGIDARKNLMLVLDDIARKNADGLVFGGDITESSQYQWFFNHLKQYYPDFKVVLGNHDDYAQAVKHLEHPSQSNEALYYSEEDGIYKYLYLDSSSSAIDNRQCEWLKQQMASSKKIILFMHHPVIGLNTGMDTIYPLQNRENLEAVLQQAHNDVHIFCGHYHMNDVRTRGNITQYITPATSFQVRKDSQGIEIYNGAFGYRMLTLTSHEITTQLFLFKGDGFKAT